MSRGIGHVLTLEMSRQTQRCELWAGLQSHTDCRTGTTAKTILPGIPVVDGGI